MKLNQLLIKETKAEYRYEIAFNKDSKLYRIDYVYM